MLHILITGVKMVKRTGPTNVYAKSLIEELRQKSFSDDAPIWRDVAEKLQKPRRQKIEVNIANIERSVNKGDIVVVPGTVLAAGDLTKAVNVAAWRFSPSAREKIKKAGGKCMTIEELVKEEPKGTGVRILV